MSLSQGLLINLLLCGSLQGLICFAWLWITSGGTPEKRPLAILILLLSLANLNIYLLYQSLPSDWNYIADIVPLIIFMPIGPLIWLYTRSILKNDYFSKKDLVHFLPIVFDIIPYLVGAFYQLDLIKSRSQLITFTETYQAYVDLPRWLSLSAYLLAAYKLTRNTNAIRINEPKLSLTRNLLIAFTIFQLIWLAFLVPYLLRQFREHLVASVGWLPLYLPLTALIYFLGIKSFLTPWKFPDSIQKSPQAIIPEHIRERAIGLLKKAMEKDKLFLDPTLSLEVIVRHTGVQQKIISAVLNQYLEMSFNEFVNRYRVNAFKDLLFQPGTQHFSLAGIAKECGFNSQATFQRVFKQIEGCSPGYYFKSRSIAQDRS